MGGGEPSVNSAIHGTERGNDAGIHPKIHRDQIIGGPILEISQDDG
jgi:hypothetical protein